MKEFPESESSLKRVIALLEGCKKLLILTHDNPDPDSIASAFAFAYLMEFLHGVQSTIAYGGIVGRAENREMVRILDIHLRKVNRIRFASYDRIALLDSQPTAGNNSLPSDVKCHLVIDHHPRRRGYQSDIVLVNTELGATATLITEWLLSCKCSIPVNVASALVYAIRSETQDLGRETCARDIKAYLSIYPKAGMKKLARITQPKLPRSYFVSLAKSLSLAMSYRQMICAHLKQVPNPEFVAEMADFLLRHRHITWVFCTGRYRGGLILSLRSSNPTARAGRAIQKITGNRTHTGGHDFFAGGRIDISNLSTDEIKKLENRLSANFARSLGHQDADWKPLTEE